MKKTLYVLLLLLLAACQSNSSNEAADQEPLSNDSSNQSTSLSELKEKPEIILKAGGEKINKQIISECWAEQCSEDSSFPRGTVDINEDTQGIQPVRVTSQQDIYIKIKGKSPDKVSYMMLKNGSSIVDATVDKDTIPVHGHGTHKILLSAHWYSQGGTFLGSKTIGLVINIKK
ncbi:hypothetical protein Q7A53_10150 [Halobacillus rhizosphaerae]|uniref:hypothetical protein n=1 Tax=Halobacillus rhizosphaerae TaxID=3064889 RepID=UPI00398AC86D